MGPWEVLGVLGGSLGGPWGDPWGSLGGPWGSLGGPWAVPGGPWGVLGAYIELSWDLLERPSPSKDSPGIILGALRLSWVAPGRPGGARKAAYAIFLVFTTFFCARGGSEGAPTE